MQGIGLDMWLTPENYFTWYYLSGQVFEPGVLALLSRRIQPGMTVYDVGANAGYLTVFCAALTGPRGKVLAFEPGPRAYGRMVENVRLNRLSNVTAVQTALSDLDGEGVYCSALREADDVYASLDAVDIPWAAPGQFRPGRIQVSRLDTLIARKSWPEPDVVKIDVEGAEHKVIAGMDAIMRSGRPLTMVLECSKPLCEKFGYTAGGFLRKLADLGFRLHLIEDDGRLTELDLQDDNLPGGRIAAIR